MRIFDLHCDTITERVMMFGESLARCGGQLDIPRLQRGGYTGQVFALYIPTHKEAKAFGADDPWTFFLRASDAFARELAVQPDVLAPLRTTSDAAAAAAGADGRIYAMLSVEDGVPIGDDLARIREMARRGVRLVTLTWNYENTLGFPNRRDPAEHARGLKPFGREAVRALYGAGIVPDVSHLSEGGFFDVAALAKEAGKPFLASHSCARALCDHPRNLTDAQLRALGEAGGVVGVNFCSGFLNAGSRVTTAEDIARHALYILDQAGEDAVALGSDFDGISGSELTFGDGEAVRDRVLGQLEGRLSARQLDKLASGNALRVLRETLPQN